MEASLGIRLEPPIPAVRSQAIPRELQPVLRREGGIDDEVVLNPNPLVELDLFDVVVLVHRGVRIGDDLNNQAGKHPLLGDLVDRPSLPLGDTSDDRDIGGGVGETVNPPLDLHVEENHDILHRFEISLQLLVQRRDDLGMRIALGHFVSGLRVEEIVRSQRNLLFDDLAVGQADALPPRSVTEGIVAPGSRQLAERIGGHVGSIAEISRRWSKIPRIGDLSSRAGWTTGALSRPEADAYLSMWKAITKRRRLS